MKTNAKRIFAFLLAVLCLMSLASVCAFAQEPYYYKYNDFYYVIKNGEITLIDYTDYESVSVIIPAEINGLPVTTIGNETFAYSKVLSDITIPDSVTTIKHWAFLCCNALTDIALPNSITTIEDEAFYDCEYLAEITIPSSVVEMGVNPFRKCERLAAIYVEESNPNYSSVDGILFNKNQTELLLYPPAKAGTCYTVPSTVTKLGADAFFTCRQLTAIAIPDSVTVIGNSAFAGCENLPNITIPDSVTSIGQNAFAGCESLTGITIPDSVISIGSWAFFGCTAFKDISIPKNVTEIGTDLFHSCSNLSTIYVDASNPNYSSADGVLFNKAQTQLIAYPIGNQRKSYTIPSQVTKLESSSFTGCKNLTNIVISDGISHIPYFVFEGCRTLTDITIPSSVTKIEAYAFEGCPALRRVHYLGTTAQWRKIDINNWGCNALTTAQILYDANVDVSEKFSDVNKGAWYYRAVDFAYNGDLFFGTTGKTLAPTQPMTRAMFVTVLGRFAGVSVNHKVTTNFKDVPTDKWYTGYVAWAAKAGIVNGTSPTTFAPEANVTREQICKMMVKYCDYAGIFWLNAKKPAVTFKDENQISDWAWNYVRTCQKAGLVNGSNGKFYPKNSASRAEVSQILMNFSNNYLK